MSFVDVISIGVRRKDSGAQVKLRCSGFLPLEGILGCGDVYTRGIS